MKRLSDLTVVDLELNPVWIHILKEEVEYVYPSERNEVSENSSESYIVRTEFIAANGRTFPGFCSPQDASGLDYVQPVIITPEGHVPLYSDKVASASQKSEYFARLRIRAQDFFPLKYRTLVKSDNDLVEGRIEGFECQEE